MGYRKLQIYSISFDLLITTHKASRTLPKYEMYELGSQLRRSAGCVVANTVSFEWDNPPLSRYERKF